MFKVPEQYRVAGEKDSLEGWFTIPSGSARKVITIIASNGLGWEHVSVSKKYDCPTWEEMCRVKDLFWDADDLVVQYHVPPSQLVNLHPYCLHMWRPVDQSIPLPPEICV
jgi:hypothetical protein